MAVEFVGCRTDLLFYCPEHNHACWEIIYNMEGSGEMLVGNETLPFYPGSIIMIPPYVPHTKYSVGQYRDMFIQVEDPLMPKKTLTFSDDSEQSFYTLLKMAHRLFHKKQRTTVAALWEVMLQLILERTANQSNEIETFKNILIDHFSDPDFNMQTAFKSTHYCTDHFRRIFKSAVGMPPIRYLHLLRINHACVLLKKMDIMGCTISDIALMCGFYDYAYFSRLFKKIIGCSPSFYKQNNF